MKLRKIFITLVVSLCLISCGGQDNYKVDKPKTPQELKAELKEIELNNPLDYLSTENVLLHSQKKLVKKETFFKNAVYEDDGALIEGYIINSATLAKFKDINFEISYYSKTESLIKKYNPDILYEIYKPNTKTYFSFKVYPPKACVNFGIKIKVAKSVY